MNATFLWYDFWGRSRYGTISSSGEATGYPASNTYSQYLSAPWRSSGLSSPYLYRDYGTTQRVGAFALCGHNLTTAATFRFRASNNANMSSPEYDSETQNVWEPIYETAEVPDSGGTSEIVDGSRLPLTVTLPLLPPPVLLHILPAEVEARYQQIDFTDGSNPDGYISIGRVLAGLSHTLTVHIANGIDLAREDGADFDENTGGQVWALSRYRMLTQSVVTDLQTEADGRAFWVPAVRHLGTAREFAVRLRDDTAGWNYWTTRYVRFPSPVQIQQQAYERVRATFTLEDII